MHAAEIKARARRMYSDAQKRDEGMAEPYQKEGLGTYDTSDHLGKKGPSAGVCWYVPVLPGILLADPWYVIGPLWGKGGLKNRLVLWTWNEGTRLALGMDIIECRTTR